MGKKMFRNRSEKFFLYAAADDDPFNKLFFVFVLVVVRLVVAAEDADVGAGPVGGDGLGQGGGGNHGQGQGAGGEGLDHLGEAFVPKVRARHPRSPSQKPNAATGSQAFAPPNVAHPIAEVERMSG